MAVNLSSKSSIFSLIVIIGAIIGIVSVFIAWFSVTDFGFTMSLTGWDICSRSNGFGSGEYVVWMPLVALIFSVVALLSGLVYLVVKQKVICVVSIVSGILIIVAAILFISYSSYGVHMWDYLGIGTYLAIISGLLVIIFGALALKTE